MVSPTNAELGRQVEVEVDLCLSFLVVDNHDLKTTFPAPMNWYWLPEHLLPVLLTRVNN
jgi:hypothetical protein